MYMYAIPGSVIVVYLGLFHPVIYILIELYVWYKVSSKGARYCTGTLGCVFG
jgi:hypothetical protein